jgi:hypothetical protein
MVSVSDGLKESNILKLMLIVRFACPTLVAAHPMVAGSSLDADTELRKLFQGSDPMADKMKPWTMPDLRPPADIIAATFVCNGFVAPLLLFSSSIEGRGHPIEFVI